MHRNGAGRWLSVCPAMNRPAFLRLRSFRVRIALLSTLLSATVLLAFGVWTWGSVRSDGLRRIDQSIRELGDRHLSRPHPPQYWNRASESLEFVLGNLSDNPFILLVKGPDNEILFVSDNWPEEIAKDTIPAPNAEGFDAGPPDQESFTEGPGRGPGMRPERRGVGRGEGRGEGRRGWGGPPDRSGPPGMPDFPPPSHGDRPPPGPGEPMQDEGPGPHGFPPPLAEEGPPQGPGARPLPIHAQTFFMAGSGGQIPGPPFAWRVGVMSNPEVTLALGLNLAPYTNEMNRMFRRFLVAAPAALLLIALGGWWLAQRALRPIQAITKTAESITAQGLDQRIPQGSEDVEFDRLVLVFNGMLNRLEKSFQQAVRFSADAAHELKTPLTILQGDLAQAVQNAVPGSEQQQTLSHLLEEVQRLKSITRKLMLLSLADSGRLEPRTEAVNLSEMLDAACEDIQILAPKLRIKKTIEDNLWTQADPDLLRQVIQNLTSNSMKYNIPGGRVVIEVHRDATRVRLVVANTGPGIPPEDQERVFERFYRADKAHNRHIDGVGLGLSLAREIVRAHHGELRLEATPEGWTAFAVILPLADAPPPQ